eukprot:m.47803 g.47803  ORF g.47803 m.47803 type:complete len:397 (+) comp13244_c0_seq2:34-1224(+)
MKVIECASVCSVTQYSTLPKLREAVAAARQEFSQEALRSESASASAILSQEQHLRDVLSLQESALARGGCYPLESCSLDLPALDAVRLTADYVIVFGQDGCLGSEPEFRLPVMNIVRMAATVVNKDAETQLHAISTRVLLNLNHHDSTSGDSDIADDDTPAPLSQISFLTSSEFVQAVDAQMACLKRCRRVQFEDIRTRKRLLEAGLRLQSDQDNRLLRQVQLAVQPWVAMGDVLEEDRVRVKSLPDLAEGLVTTGVYGLQQLFWLVQHHPRLCQQLLSRCKFPFFSVVTSCCQTLISALSLPEQAFRGDLATRVDTMTAIPWLLCHSEDRDTLNQLLAMLLAAVLDNSRMDHLEPDDFPLAVAQARRQLQEALTTDPRPTTLTSLQARWQHHEWL